MKLVAAMLENINNNLCVDQTRIFSTGFSFGGMMSYTLPFEFDVFRAREDSTAFSRLTVARPIWQGVTE
jgi:poly(3-hydroxybutyrate) depolymerase